MDQVKRRDRGLESFSDSGTPGRCWPLRNLEAILLMIPELPSRADVLVPDGAALLGPLPGVTLSEGIGELLGGPL